MDLGTTATNNHTHTHTPELPMLEPTHPRVHHLGDLSARALDIGQLEAAFVLAAVDLLVRDLNNGVQLKQACHDLEDTLSEWYDGEGMDPKLVLDAFAAIDAKRAN